jgi:ElaB/YqjD/DUF883 family membrane-anchored ribosome-binding protein
MNKITDTIRSAKISAKDGLVTAKSKAGQGTKVVRDKASSAYDRSKEAAAKGAQKSRKLASQAAEKSSDAIDKNPLAMVVGGLALGAIIGALLPKSKREVKVLGKTGQKLNAKAKQVTIAAKDAGKEKIESLGINKDQAREQFRDLVSKASEAVKAAGQAASEATRKKD